MLEASRRLGIARGTVQARLDKLASAGVITGWGPDLSPEAIGFPVTAFLTLEIRQGSADRGGHDAVAAHLAGIPEVLEAYTITGAGDMWARVVARSNADLQRVIDLVLTEPGIDRSTTVIALATQIPYRVRPARAGGGHLSRSATAAAAAITWGATTSSSMAPSSVTMPTLARRPSTPRTGAARPRAPVCSSPLVTAYAASSRSTSPMALPAAPCVSGWRAPTR